MNSTCRLPLNFDPGPLQEDLVHIQATEWVRHFNADYFDGDWEGIALRSIGGVAHQIYPDPHATGEVLDTEILARCPNIRAVLSSFECDIQSARLLRLTPGSRIKEHRDYNLDFEEGEVRLHVPIVTNDQVEFYLNGCRVVMSPGECWFLNFSLPHKVANNGNADRVHLVVDCTLNDWLRAQLAAGESQENLGHLPVTSRGGWEEFRTFVLSNPDVQALLRETNDRLAFAELATSVGAGYGFTIDAREVGEMIREMRKSWFRTWID